MVSLKEELQDYFEDRILNISAVSGGDINESYQINTPKKVYFLKLNRTKEGYAILKAEDKGLKTLKKSDGINVAEPIRLFKFGNGGGLILEYYPPSTNSKKGFIELGHQLARLHRIHQEEFGLDHHNFIGRLFQSNTKHRDWTDFYREERILPQIQLALQSGRMESYQFKQLESFFTRIENLFPQEPPSLIHGDLWAGNFLLTNNDNPIFIDPSVSFCHREMDIAMSKLFGGFSISFYEAYNEIYPLEKAFDIRCDLYQLYYLLVHVNLFGGSYVPPVLRIIKNYS